MDLKLDKNTEKNETVRTFPFFAIVPLFLGIINLLAEFYFTDSILNFTCFSLILSLSHFRQK